MIASLAAFAAVALLTPLATRLLGRRVFAVDRHRAGSPSSGCCSRGCRAWSPASRSSSSCHGSRSSTSRSRSASTRSRCCSPSSSRASARSCCSTACTTSPTTNPALGRFAALLLAFAGVMYGLVTSDDVFLLFMFWEATSVLSYLLIGHYTGRKESRGAALQALTVTTFGGLAMLVGLVVLVVAGGTSSLAELIAHPVTGAAAEWGIALVLVGAISKSALVPFHFWLPAAMAAPTPVSAYLHAAAMVKAGIYLVARLAPGYADLTVWHPIVIALGVLTMLVGGWRALRQYDLKLLLAYGTVSQLGFLVLVTGYGTRDAALAGVALLLAHALFKSALFLVVGIVDHAAGTRDWRRLSGLGRRMPVIATIAIVAAASMVGLPPLLGFVAKEAVFTAFLEAAAAGEPWAWSPWSARSLGSVLTVAYTVRFVWGAFFTKAGVEPTPLHAESPAIGVAPGILSAASLVAAFAIGSIEPLLAAVRRRAPRARGVPPRALARPRARPVDLARGVRARRAARVGPPARGAPAGRRRPHGRLGARLPRHRLGRRPARGGRHHRDPAPRAARLPRDHRGGVRRGPRRGIRHEHHLARRHPALGLPGAAVPRVRHGRRGRRRGHRAPADDGGAPRERDRLRPRAAVRHVAAHPTSRSRRRSSRRSCSWSSCSCCGGSPRRSRSATRRCTRWRAGSSARWPAS